MYAPNLLTFLRILLVPLAIWLIVTGALQAAFFVFLIAGLTDAFDGFLAKRFGWESDLGAYLDPLADKMLLVSIFVALGVRGDIPSWLVIIVVSRDLMIVAAVLISAMLGRPVSIRPLFVGKLSTVSQIALALLVLADDGFGLGLTTLRAIGVYLAGVLTLVSAGAYLRAWLRHMMTEEASGPPGSPGLPPQQGRSG